MASSSTQSTSGGSEVLELGNRVLPLFNLARIVGVVGLVAALVLGYVLDRSLKLFFFSYLTAFCYVLSLSVGGLFFVLLQFMTKAGWSVNVRRVGEWMSAAMPVLAGMAVPVVVAVWLHNGTLYRWSQPGWGEAGEVPTASTPAVAAPVGQDVKRADSAGPSGSHVSASKRVYLSPIAFTLRLALYFGIWSFIGGWYWKQSTLQDRTGDYHLTEKMQARAAPALVICAITVTLAAFDLIMSLDPSWASTIFGVYYFAGSMVAFFSTASIIVILLQNNGYLKRSLTIEHYHDLGKFTFAFVFFWGYIAFSQFMLIWYGNIPEETEWFRRRGATTVPGNINGYTFVILAILFGHLLIPFAGLLSRHVKRSRTGLGFWACWLLVFHYVDLYWLIMPEMDTAGLNPMISGLHLPVVVELCALVGLLGLYVAALIKLAAHESLRPVHDPRLPEALAFQNI